RRPLVNARMYRDAFDGFCGRGFRGGFEDLANNYVYGASIGPSLRGQPVHRRRRRNSRATQKRRSIRSGLAFTPPLPAAEFLNGWRFFTVQQADEFVVTGVDRESGIRQHACLLQPATSLENRASREPHAPEVVVHPAFIAQAMNEAGFLQKLVEFRT